MLLLFLLFSSLLLSLSICDFPCKGPKSYTVTLNFMWNSEVDKMIPSDLNIFVGFESIFCVSHNEKFQLWSPGNITSHELRQILLFQNETALNTTLDDSKSPTPSPRSALNAKKLGTEEGGRSESESSATADFKFRGEGNFTLLSCFAAIVPSPGWFIGIYALNVCNGTSGFVSTSAKLKGWNSGIFNNDAYIYENQELLAPPATIRPLLGFAESYGNITISDSQLDDDVSSSSSCFPADETIHLASGNVVTIAQLAIGDNVMAGREGISSRVFMFSHRDYNVNTTFLNIQFRINQAEKNVSDSLMSSLRISRGHFLYRVQSKALARGLEVVSEDHVELVMASQVRKGDALVGPDDKPRFVQYIDIVVAKGLYNPHSLQGDLVVSGVRVSSFTSAVRPGVAIGAMAPVRGLYRYGIWVFSRWLSDVILKGEWNDWVCGLVWWV